MSDKIWSTTERGVVAPGGYFMKSGCRHRRMGACGACYARLYLAMQEISMRPRHAKAIVDEVSAAMKAEKKP